MRGPVSLDLPTRSSRQRHVVEFLGLLLAVLSDREVQSRLAARGVLGALYIITNTEAVIGRDSLVARGVGTRQGWSLAFFQSALAAAWTLLVGCTVLPGRVLHRAVNHLVLRGAGQFDGSRCCR